MKNVACLAALLVSLFLLSSGCATAGPSKKQQVYDEWLLSNQPFDKVPLVLDEMKEHGTVTPARYQKLLAEWKAKKPEWERQQAANRAKDLAFRKKKERELASLTPAQRLDLEMRQKELDLKKAQLNAQVAGEEEQQRQARRQALGNAFSGAMNQIREDQRRQEDFNRALILQRMRSLNPHTYDSTVTPSLYPGGPAYIHTEERGY